MPETNGSKPTSERGYDMRQIILFPDETGYWIAEVPSLPGCGSDGPTREEALANVQDAIKGYIEALEVDGLPVPEENREVVTLDI
jgi:predicted RNase H-like HicB family nuclease